MADVSSYDSSLPSGSSEIRKGDDRLRTHWWDLESALTEEHYFTDSTGSGGQHKPGSSRLSHGDGAPTSGDEGRLFYDVPTNTLVVQGSSATTAAAGAFVGAKAERSTSQDFPAAATTSAISWNNELYDTSGFFSATTSLLVAPSDGKYAVVCEASLTTSAPGGKLKAGDYELNLEERTQDSTFARSGFSVSRLGNVRISGVVDLSGGSTVEATFRHNEANATLTGDISIHKLGN